MKCCCKRFLTIGKWAGFILLFMVAFLGGQYWLWIRKAHEVVPGDLYRSAQLSPKQFREAIQKNKIQAVLNLRGGNSDELWYRQEREAAKHENIRYYDLPMHSYVMPTKAQLLALVQVLLTSPKPLLVHCEGGADRTGLASAIYLILQNKPLAEAEKEYSLQYYVIYGTSVGKLVIPHYAAWLKQNNLPSSKQNFLKWLENS